MTFIAIAVTLYKLSPLFEYHGFPFFNCSANWGWTLDCSWTVPVSSFCSCMKLSFVYPCWDNNNIPNTILFLSRISCSWISSSLTSSNSPSSWTMACWAVSLVIYRRYCSFSMITPLSSTKKSIQWPWFLRTSLTKAIKQPIALFHSTLILRLDSRASVNSSMISNQLAYFLRVILSAS